MASYIIGREVIRNGKIEGLTVDILDLLDLPAYDEIYIKECKIGKLICTGIKCLIVLQRCDIDTLIALPPVPNVCDVNSKIKRMFGEFETDTDYKKRFAPSPHLQSDELDEMTRVSIDCLYKNKEMFKPDDYILNKYFAWCEDSQRPSIRELLAKRWLPF